MRITRRSALLAAGGMALAGCADGAEPAAPSTGSPSSTGASTVPTGAASPGPSTSKSALAANPALRVEKVVAGLENPWGLGFVEEAVVLTERPGRLGLLRDGKVEPVDVDLADVVAQGEGGLTGLAVSPDFARDRRIVVCFNTAKDIRVVPLVLSKDLRSATRGTPLVTGLPVNPSGRHSGCRPVFGPDGMLWIGTGDTARGTLPQDLDSLGGKVLRVDPTTGKGAPDNPWATAKGARALVHTYGHRNIQGLARHPDGRMFSVEHGSDVDDEVNLLAMGANYGWKPVGSGEYDESVPMTDTTLPGARKALWSSGSPTLATSGACFVRGPQWGGLDGALLVACLKAQRLLAMHLDTRGGIASVESLAELEGTHGRLRTVEQAPDGSVWVSTSNGSDDALLRVSPQ